jgi:hypothetical protein
MFIKCAIPCNAHSVDWKQERLISKRPAKALLLLITYPFLKQFCSENTLQEGNDLIYGILYA